MNKNSFKSANNEIVKCRNFSQITKKEVELANKLPELKKIIHIEQWWVIFQYLFHLFIKNCFKKTASYKDCTYQAAFKRWKSCFIYKE